MEPSTVFSTVLWCVQILTAGVLLLNAYFDLLTNVRRKHPPPQDQAPPHPDSVPVSGNPLPDSPTPEQQEQQYSGIGIP